MKKPELAKRLARRSGLTEAEAADRLDGLVRQILSNLRKGRTATLPGLGTFTQGPDGRPAFAVDREKPRD